MTQSTIDRIQPLLDEYSLIRIKYDKIKNKYQPKEMLGMSIYEAEQIKELEKLMEHPQKAIMQILFDSNIESVQQKITK